MRADANKGAAAMRRTAGLATELKGQTIPANRGRLHYTTLEPWGVVARNIAFNHPTLFAAARLAPAVIAGNAVILKPSELASLSTLALAGLADGLVSVIKTITLELGGKNPIIVFPDADLDPGGRRSSAGDELHPSAGAELRLDLAPVRPRGRSPAGAGPCLRAGVAHRDR